MKKSLGIKKTIFPMSVLMIETYNEDGGVDVNKMNDIMYDQFNYGFYRVGKNVGSSYSDGEVLK